MADIQRKIQGSAEILDSAQAQLALANKVQHCQVWDDDGTVGGCQQRAMYLQLRGQPVLSKYSGSSCRATQLCSHVAFPVNIIMPTGLAIAFSRLQRHNHGLSSERSQTDAMAKGVGSTHINLTESGSSRAVCLVSQLRRSHILAASLYVPMVFPQAVRP
eukprot:scaffold408635_cov22-Prasinocladus_malaysianus.AAC.1